MSEEYAKQLEPFIAGAKPDERGEIQIFCPLHNDTRRSANLNLKIGAWFCHAGCGGGSVRRLVEASDTWVPPEGRVRTEARPSASTTARGPVAVTMKDVRRWHRRFKKDGVADYLYELRGISPKTAERARIGWDGSRFKIPVFSPERTLWNVRTYDPNPGDRRKIWSVRGMGQARLYPIGQLLRADRRRPVLFCEGEWDALLAIQHGAVAITRTDGAGKPWREEWTETFRDRHVYLAHDRDEAGAKGDRIVGKALEPVAAGVWQTELPFEMRPKGGLDISDFLLDEDDPEAAIADLLDNAKKWSDE